MIPEKVTTIYFSPTNGSKKNADAIASAFSCPKESIDITTPDFEGKSFDGKTLVIFSAPCYGGRIPSVAASRFEAFSGNNTPCVLSVTYGNRDFDDSLAELCDIAVKNGFIPIGAAALIGQHTFGEIAVGRPDRNDLAAAKTFGVNVLGSLKEGIKNISGIIPGNRPYKEGGKGGRFRPRTLDTCTLCGLCAENCPVKAIGDDFKTIDDSKCISCFRCIKQCPSHAKVMDTPEYTEFAEAFSQKLSIRRENMYFI